MKIEKTTCPYCGASLKLSPGQKTAECEYCGSSVLITDTGSAPPDPDPADNTLQSSKNQGICGKSNVTPEPTESMPGKHALFPPPGFRSGNIVHMIAAVIGYLFILCVAVNLGGLPDAVFFTIASLSVVDICTGWTGAYAGVKGARRLIEQENLRFHGQSAGNGNALFLPAYGHIRPGEASHDLSRVLPTACLAAGPPFGVRTAFPPYSLGSAVTLPQQ